MCFVAPLEAARNFISEVPIYEEPSFTLKSDQVHRLNLAQLTPAISLIVPKAG